MKMLKQAILCLALAVTSLTLVSGCRTAEGFGEDMENAGEEIQKETR
jgi:predicted small secreted protein